jgi:hypothetical protein
LRVCASIGPVALLSMVVRYLPNDESAFSLVCMSLRSVPMKDLRQDPDDYTSGALRATAHTHTHARTHTHHAYMDQLVPLPVCDRDRVAASSAVTTSSATHRHLSLSLARSCCSGATDAFPANSPRGRRIRRCIRLDYRLFTG